MKIKQYVYFGISSEVLTAETIAGRIDLTPDKTQTWQPLGGPASAYTQQVGAREL